MSVTLSETSEMTRMWHQTGQMLQTSHQEVMEGLQGPVLLLLGTIQPLANSMRVLMDAHQQEDLMEGVVAGVAPLLVDPVMVNGKTVDTFQVL